MKKGMKREELIKKIEENPDNIENHRALADFYLSKKDFKSAYDVYQNILKIQKLKNIS